MAWQGWPTGWDTPLWNGQTGYSRLVSTLWTCIDINTRQLASFPIYGVKGVSVVPLPEWSNNPEPELYSDWTECAKQMFNTFQAHGEIILWGTGRYKDGLGPNGIGSVARFVVLNPALVNIEWRNGDITYSMGDERLRPGRYLPYQVPIPPYKSPRYRTVRMGGAIGNECRRSRNDEYESCYSGRYPLGGSQIATQVEWYRISGFAKCVGSRGEQ